MMAVGAKWPASGGIQRCCGRALCNNFAMTATTRQCRVQTESRGGR